MIHPTELISAYLDGELHGAEQSQLQEHLAGCGKCSVDMEQLQFVRSAVRSLPVLELPEGIVPEADPVVVPLRRHKGMWVGAAAAVVAAVIAIAAIVTPEPGSASLTELNSQYAARSTLDPAFGPAKLVLPPLPGE